MVGEVGSLNDRLIKETSGWKMTAVQSPVSVFSWQTRACTALIQVTALGLDRQLSRFLAGELGRLPDGIATKLIAFGGKYIYSMRIFSYVIGLPNGNFPFTPSKTAFLRAVLRALPSTKEMFAAACAALRVTSVNVLNIYIARENSIIPKTTIKNIIATKANSTAVAPDSFFFFLKSSPCRKSLISNIVTPSGGVYRYFNSSGSAAKSR